MATAPLVILAGWTIADFPLIDKVWVDIGIVTLGYLTNPVMLSPDMDLVHSDPSNRWGKLEPLLWVYQGLIHKGGGRNPLSHWPPLSSLLRVFYLWAALFIAGVATVGILDLIYWGLFSQTLVPWNWVKTAFSYWVLVFTFPLFWKFVWGVALGDLIHLVADVSYSFMRK